MLIDWPQFLAALVLLLTPGDWFCDKQKTRYRELSRDWSDFWPRILSHGMHTIDFARAALGTWLLLESLHSVPNARGAAKYAVLFTQGSIRIFAVVLQTTTCRQADSANAPFAFVTGLLLTGISPLVAAFALAFTIPIAMGSNTPAAFFPVLGIMHLAIGFWFKGQGAVFGLSFGAIAAILPTVISLAFHRELVVPYRAKRGTTDKLPDPLR